MKLIIIAAGQGSRLRAKTDKPKTLTKIHGTPIIDTLLNNCKKNSIKEILIITGYNSNSIEKYLHDRWRDLNVRYIYNDEWRLENGISVLKAMPNIELNEEFLISMSDHLYFSDSLEVVMNSQLNNKLVNVGLDLNIESIFDIEDGMKVQVDTESFIISKMSKNLRNYNAIDIGLFKCKYDFFHYLNGAYKKNQCSLSSGCNALIKDGLLGGVDIDNRFWLDIDTPEALHYAMGNEKVKDLIINQ